MRVAVVGAGLFGSTAAIHLARAGHEVHLYERSGELLSAASGINQGRIHEGHHYPRSPETAAECQAGLSSFLGEYGDAVISSGKQFYAIAREGSKVSALQYAAFCMQAGLYFAPCRPEFVSRGAVEAVFSVNEGRIDLRRLRNIVGWRLNDAGVIVHWRAAEGSLRREFDRIVIAAYASTNDVAAEFGAPVEPLQFEVVEKPVVRMPPEFRDVGVVVMDGEFCCVDPYGRTGLHVMGHVQHAIHAANVGFWPEVPGYLKDCLNCGVVVVPEHTRFQDFIEAGVKFIPGLRDAEHVGSMWTVRAVLPDLDATDARPTLVSVIDEKVIRVFGGKLGCAVTAAERVVEMLQSSRGGTDAQAAVAA